MLTMAGVYLACALLLQAPDAHRPRAIRLRVISALPFSLTELVDAVSARAVVGEGPDARDVTVGPQGPDGVEVRMGDRRATVPIGDRSSVTAARVVALVIADLAGDAPVAIARQDRAIQTTPEAPSPAPLPDRVAVVLDLAHGFSSAEATSYGLSADVTRRRHDLIFGGALGLWVVPTQSAGRADQASLVAGMVRLWFGSSWHRFEALAGPFVAPYHLGGAFDRAGVLAGGGVVLRACRRLGRDHELLALLGVDAFANRFQTAVTPSPPSYATPRVSVRVGMGLSFDLGSP